MTTDVREKRPALVDVGAVADFPEGEARVVQAGERRVVITCWNGHLFAAMDRCPHQGGPMCGHLRPAVQRNADAPGRFDVDAERGILACAWHGWEFDVTNGHAIWDDRFRVRTYPVEITDDRVLVRLRPARAA